MCWRLLAIAGTGFAILGGVIVVLAKKLWETGLARLSDKNETIAQLVAAKHFSAKKREESP